MDVRTVEVFPGADVAAVVAMFLSRDFRLAVCRETGSSDCTAEVEAGSDAGARVVVRRSLPAQVPDIARRFVGSTIHLEQEELWQPPQSSVERSAALTVRVVGQSVTMSGVIRVVAVAEGVRVMADNSVRVPIPLVGRRIEAEIARALEGAARIEEAVGRRWLGG